MKVGHASSSAPMTASSATPASSDTPAAPDGAGAAVVAGAEAYERWRAESLIARVFEVSADPGRFRSRVDYRGFGSALVLEFEMSAARHLRTAERARRDGLDMIWVQLAQTGGFVGASPGRSTTAGPKAAALCDFSVSVEQHSAVSSGSALLIPREAFDGEDPRVLHGAAVTGGRYGLLHDYVRWLRSHAARSRVRDGDATTRAIALVAAACFGSPAPFGADVAGELGPIALQRACSFIAERLAEPDLRTADIAHASGVSRATLYRLCAPAGGVVELVWSMRLDAVRQALSDPQRPGRIAEIAAAYGFVSPQHFSRRFRQTYGFSPRNLRPF